MISSTGLSSRFLPRLSLFALTAVQVHMAYLYLVPSERMGYSQWIRYRSALRALTSAGVYLRMLGVQMSDGAGLPRCGSYKATVGGPYAIGIALMSAANALMGFVCLPFQFIHVDRGAQLMESGSNWFPIGPVAEMVLAVGLLLASLLYSVPLLIYSGGGGGGVMPVSASLRSEQLFYRGDCLTAIGTVVLAMLRDCNFSYWSTVGSDVWLQARQLVDSAITLMGMAVMIDLFKHQSVSPPRANESRPADGKAS